MLLGGADPDVFCKMERTQSSGEAEDHVKIVLHAPGRPTVNIQVSATCAYPQDHWLVMGTQGGLVGTGRELRWKYFDPAKLPPGRSPPIHPDRSYNPRRCPGSKRSTRYPASRRGLPISRSIVTCTDRSAKALPWQSPRRAYDNRSRFWTPAAG